MNTENTLNIGTNPKQIVYANVLNKGMLLGLIVLVITFALYVFGVITPYVPVEELSQYWHLPVNDYLHELNIPDGWGWLSMLKYSDFINFIGIAFLAGITILCYIAIIPVLLKNNDIIYAIIAVLEVIVLLAAATGLIAGGGH